MPFSMLIYDSCSFNINKLLWNELVNNFNIWKGIFFLINRGENGRNGQDACLSTSFRRE